MNDLATYIRVVPDFPIKGVMFRDISPLLEGHFSKTIQAIGSLLSPEEMEKVDYFAGVDARGFIFASAMAERFGKNFKMIRKAGKIPPPFSEIEYATEYSKAGMQVMHGQGRVAIVDDVLATGGTMSAAASICEKAGYDVTALLTLIDLPYVHKNSYQWNGIKVRSVLSYDTP